MSTLLKLLPYAPLPTKLQLRLEIVQSLISKAMQAFDARKCTPDDLQAYTSVQALNVRRITPGDLLAPNVPPQESPKSKDPVVEAPPKLTFTKQVELNAQKGFKPTQLQALKAIREYGAVIFTEHVCGMNSGNWMVLPFHYLSSATSVSQLRMKLVMCKYALDYADRDKQSAICREIRILSQVLPHHPNIVHFETFDQMDQRWLSTTALTGGTLKLAMEDLRYYVSKYGTGEINPSFIWHVFHQLAQALAHLHLTTRNTTHHISSPGNAGTRPVAHRDIHDRNLVFDTAAPRDFPTYPNLRLIDFGHSAASQSENPPFRADDPVPRDEGLYGSSAGRYFNMGIEVDLVETGNLVHSVAHAQQTKHVKYTCKLRQRDGTCDCIVSGFKSKHADFGPDDQDFKQCMQLLSWKHVKQILPEHYPTLVDVCARRRAAAAAKMKKKEMPEVWMEMRPSVEDVKMWTKSAVEALEADGVEVSDPVQVKRRR